MRNYFVKRVVIFAIILAMVFPISISATGIERVLTGNGNNRIDQRVNGFDYEAWTDHRGADGISMTIYNDGSFFGEWTRTYNTLFRVGRRFPRNTRIDSLGEVSVSYSAPEFRTSGGATYLGLYGWTRDPLIEWYIMDSWIDFNVMQIAGTDNVVHHGTVTTNGHVYDIVTNWRINQPSIAGERMSTFLQIFSIRQNSRRNRTSTTPLSGTIDVSAHFEAWEKRIEPQTLTIGERTHTASFIASAALHEIMFLVEGFGGEQFSTGSGRVDKLCIRYGNNSVCTSYGCSNCTGTVPEPTPSPEPTSEPTPEPTPTPAPTLPLIPTPTPAPPNTSPTMRFEVGSHSFTTRGNNQTLEAAPFIDNINGRTMVPLRAVAEGLGATIDWNETTRTISFVRDGEIIHLTIGVELPVGMGTAEIVSGRTFVPVRYVSEIFGAEVRWQSATRAVYIY
ncbi:MAG: glycoside hydrolase family 11 protein [Defluviitaleaceae bacterium]|nr:glycoside hydrolase family 11 protein [Defluviitaleaceae bacterium]